MQKNPKKFWNYVRSKTNSRDKIGDLIVKNETKTEKVISSNQANTKYGKPNNKYRRYNQKTKQFKYFQISRAGLDTPQNSKGGKRSNRFTP